MTTPPLRRPTPKASANYFDTDSTWKVGIYGPEGVGKSKLVALCPNIRVADIEFSMKKIKLNPGQKQPGIETWENLLAWVDGLSNCWAGIDSMTRAEDWAAQYVIANKKSNEGAKATDSLEDFKYKAGLRFVTDEFKKLLAKIDNATRRNVSFVMTAHNRVKQFKNPEGSDYIRHEPNLVDATDVSNMRSWVQFLDVCAFVDLDLLIEKRKATGNTRSIYLDTSASHISKARGIDNSTIDYKEGSIELWERLGIK